jgi:hypothetical protein
MTKPNSEPPLPPITVNVTVGRPETAKRSKERLVMSALTGLLILGAAIGYLLAHGDVTIVLGP